MIVNPTFRHCFNGFDGSVFMLTKCQGARHLGVPTQVGRAPTKHFIGKLNQYYSLPSPIECKQMTDGLLANISRNVLILLCFTTEA